MIPVCLSLLLLFCACGKQTDTVSYEQEQITERLTEESTANTEARNSSWKTVWEQYEEFSFPIVDIECLKNRYYPMERSHYHESSTAKTWRIAEEINAVMYAEEDQPTFSAFLGTALIDADVTPMQYPYVGVVAGELKAGTPVFVRCSIFNRHRPQDGVVYVIDHRMGTPFTEEYTYAYVDENMEGYQGYHDSSDYAYAFGYALRLSDTEPEPNSKEYFHKEVETSEVWHDEKMLWMKELWPDWEAFIQTDYGFVGDAEEKIDIRQHTLEMFYPEEDYWEIFYPERYEDAVMVQKEKTDVIMYATERQLVYAEIMPTVKGPLKDPYYGPVVGALEKGEPVRVVSVIENQQRPEDGEYYGIAIDLEIGSTPFLSEYMDPFVERFGADAFGSNSAAYGYAVKLSPTPPSE